MEVLGSNASDDACAGDAVQLIQARGGCFAHRLATIIAINVEVVGIVTVDSRDIRELVQQAGYHQALRWSVEDLEAIAATAPTRKAGNRRCGLGTGWQRGQRRKGREQKGRMQGLHASFRGMKLQTCAGRAPGEKAWWGGVRWSARGVRTAAGTRVPI